MNRRRASLKLFSLIVIVLCLLVSLPASSHDPITTSVTFSKEVIRILQKHCLACHSPGRIKGDIPLTTFEEARPWAKAIKEEVLEKRMPPYQAVKGYGDFHNPYLLSTREIELLVSWIEGGAPRGESKDLPTEITPANHWRHGQPQLILQAALATKIPVGTGEFSACLKIPTKLKQPQMVKAIEFLPGKAAAVTAAEIFLQKQCNASCGSGEKIGEWSPGQDALQFPANTSVLMPANACLSLKIRYKQGEAETQDQSRIGFYFADNEAPFQLQRIAFSPTPQILPPGTKSPISVSYTMREDGEAIAIRPLLFPLATGVEAKAIRPDGSAEVLIVAQAYRYNWQPSYFYKQPVKLPVGTRIEVTAHLDNSEANRNLQDDPKSIKFAQPIAELILAKPRSNYSKVSTQIDSHPPAMR